MTVRTIEKKYPDTVPGRYDRPPIGRQSENLTDMARTFVLRQMAVAIPAARIFYAMGHRELDE